MDFYKASITAPLGVETANYLPSELACRLKLQQNFGR